MLPSRLHRPKSWWSIGSSGTMAPAPLAASSCNALAIDTFSSLFFLLEHFSQQSRRGRPANAYQRFAHSCSYCHWRTDLPYPPLIFTGGQTVRFLALSLTNARFWAAVVWKRSMISSPFLNLVCSDDLTMFPPCLLQIGARILKSPRPMLRLEHPLKTNEKSVVNHQ